MTAKQLVQELKMRGVEVWSSADGEKIRLRGDGPRIPADIREGLLRHKSDVISILQDRMRAGPGRYRCAGCFAWFPQAELTSVPEQVGRGFRCVDCLRVGVRHET